MGRGRRRKNRTRVGQDPPVEGKKPKMSAGDEVDADGASSNLQLDSRSEDAANAPVAVVTEGKRRDKEAKHLLNIFPEEIWHCIFDAMLPNDLENVSNASVYFRELLLPKRVLFLFPKVWEVLGVKYEKDNDPVYMEYEMTDRDYEGMRCTRDSDRSAEEVVQLTRLTYSPWFRTILKFRLICQTWSQAVDEFYRSHPRHYEMEHDPEIYKKTENDLEPEDDDNRKIGSWVETNFYQQRPEIFQEMSTHFEQTHRGTDLITSRCPLFARTVTFESTNDNIVPFADPVQGHREIRQAERFWNEISAFLLKYGHHIWNCVLEVRDHFPSRVAYYSKLREWMELMPNLKVFDIQYSRLKPGQSYKGGCYCCSVSHQEHVCASSDELVELEREMKLNPLPNIESLEYIKTTDLPSPIFNQLVSQNCHVSMLESKQENFVGDYAYDIYSVPMSNLRQLSVNINRIEDIGRMGSLAVVWPLEKLYLDFHGSPFVEWPIIFSMLQDKWANSLTHLMVNLPRAKSAVDKKRIVREYSNLRLDLPLVKRLKLRMYNYSSLDFILPMKDSLEFLDIGYNLENVMELRKGLVSAAWEKKQIIKDLHEWREEMLFPKLKRIDEDDQGSWQTRSNWKKEMEKKGK